MRILFVIHQFLPEFNSGTERFVYNLAKSAQRAGHSVEVLTCAVNVLKWEEGTRPPMLRASVDGIPVVAIPRNLLGTNADIDFVLPPPRALEAFHAFFSDRQFDVCHIAHSMRMYGALEWITRNQVPYIVSLTDFYSMCYRVNFMQINGSHCAAPRKGLECAASCPAPVFNAEQFATRSTIAKNILNNASAVIACSNFVAKAFSREFPDLPIKTQPHGVDVLAFTEYAKSAASSSGGKPELTLGYLGTLSDQKGIRALVDGFARVDSPNIRLRLVGDSHGSGDLESHLNAMTQKDSRITMDAGVSFGEVPAILASFDIACISSVVPETFSFVMHEAFAAGVPTMVSDIGNLGVVTKENGCGALVRPGSSDAWTEAIGQVARNPEMVANWRSLLPLPVRVEEESFHYEICYRGALNKTSTL